jgi:hypothetical protein
MTNKTMTTMKEFVDKVLFREIIIKSHCSGFQVVLCDGHREISRGVSGAIDSAFEDAMKPNSWDDKDYDNCMDDTKERN